MPNVRQLAKTLRDAADQLDKQDPEADTAHILCPAGGYSGDFENTFTNIKVDGPDPEDKEEGETTVTLWLHY